MRSQRNLKERQYLLRIHVEKHFLHSTLYTTWMSDPSFRAPVTSLYYMTSPLSLCQGYNTTDNTQQQARDTYDSLRISRTLRRRRRCTGAGRSQGDRRRRNSRTEVCHAAIRRIRTGHIRWDGRRVR